MNALWLRQWIKREKALTVVFDQGADLLDKIAEEAPTVVIMDVNMPGMGGLDCAYMIRTDQTYKDVQLIVISEIFAYSLVHQAEVAGVDLFSDPYHMPIKVLRFLKQAFGLAAKKTPLLQSQAHLDEISQRLQDRYPLQGKLTITHGDHTIEGKFENISMAGSLVHLTQIPPQGAQISLQWILPNKETYTIDAISVRQSMVFEPIDEYVWVVGLKFLDMAPAMMEQLDNLIQTIAKFYEKKFEFIDFQRIREMLSRKESYFAEILQGHRQPSIVVERSMNEVKAYERHAYGGNDPSSRGIARLMALRITARVLRKSLDWVKIHPDEGLRQCLPLITQLMKTIDQTEDRTEKLLVKATKSDDKELRRQLIESSNLLSDQKDLLIQCFYQYCANMSPEPSMTEDHQQMIQRYNQLQSYAHFLEAEEKAQVQRNAQQGPLYKASEATLREKKRQETIRFQSQIRKNLISNALKYAAAVMSLITLLSLGLGHIESFIKPETLQLSLMIQKVRLESGHRLNIQTTKSAWAELSQDQRVQIIDQLEVYLTRMAYHQAKLIDEHGNLLAGIMSTYDPDRLIYYPLLFD